MKKLIFSLIMFVAFINLNAQPGMVNAKTVDTVKGNENIYLSAAVLGSKADVLTLEADFSKISSAAGGTAYLQGSVNGTTYTTLTSQSGLFIFYPNDTVTITDNGTMKAIIIDNPLKYYRWFIDGDVNDTVIIKPYNIYK